MDYRVRRPIARVVAGPPLVYRGTGPKLPSRPPVEPMRLVLFQPDIPQNTGAILRLAACLGVAVDVIEPCGFVWDEPRMRRAGMDYLDGLELRRHDSWAAFRGRPAAGRLLLLTTRGDDSYAEFAFRADDRLLLGRESAGVPEAVHEAADARLVVPMRPGLRALNVAMAAAIVLSEALRQTGRLPAVVAPSARRLVDRPAALPGRAPAEGSA